MGVRRHPHARLPRLPVRPHPALPRRALPETLRRRGLIATTGTPPLSPPPDDAPPSRQTSGPNLDPLPRLVGYALRRTQVAVFRRFRREFADHDIRPAHLGVLTVVHNNPGLKQTEVSAALGIKRTNFGPLLDGLVSRGLVRRTKVATDRRAVGLHLTPEGERLVALLQEREAAFERELAALIGEDGRRTLLRLLDQVALTCREDGEG